MKRTNYAALIGLVLLLPACLLISGGIFEFHVPRALSNPITLMGGLLTSLVVNALAVLRVQAEREQSGGIAAVTVRIGTRVSNLAVIAICVLLLAAIAGYLFVENFQPRVFE